MQMHPGSENMPECLRWTLKFSPWDQQRTKAIIKKRTNTVSSIEEYTTPPATSRGAQQVPQGEALAASGQRWGCCDLGTGTSA